MTISIDTTVNEAAQVEAWETMSDDQKGEYLHYAKQEANYQDVAAKAATNEWINDHSVQYLADGSAQVGGELRPDALINVEGIEMTVQQAVDLGLRSASSIGMQIGSMQ